MVGGGGGDYFLIWKFGSLLLNEYQDSLYLVQILSSLDIGSLNFRKFKVALSATHRIFLTSVKSYA